VSTKIDTARAGLPQPRVPDEDRGKTSIIVKKVKTLLTFLEMDNKALILHRKNVFYSQ
jgi:hypothetical protein